MRDLVIAEALQQLAVEAGERLAALVAAGEDIPFEVDEEPGATAPLYCYAPRTEEFIRDRRDELRELPSFGPAVAAVASSGMAEPYLETLGIQSPPGAEAEAEEMLVAFLGRLWTGSVDFSLEQARLELALEDLEQSAADDAAPVEVVVPIVGLQLPVQRLELGRVTLVRSDTVEAPAEARRPEGMARTVWEPPYLAAIRCDMDDCGPSPVARGQLGLRNLITVLRLFKDGAVGLGPHAWTRTGDGPWRRIATGAPRPRGGGYWLAESEVGELRAFASALAERPVRGGSLAWAVSRFEMGLERISPLHGLSDHLLALRALLEGGGPAELSLPARVAALCAEPHERDAVRAGVEAAIAVERDLMSGLVLDPEEDAGAVELAAATEDRSRAILRDATCGHLGSELRSTADEILLADGAVPVATAEESAWDGARSYDPPTGEESVHAGEPAADHRPVPGLTGEFEPVAEPEPDPAVGWARRPAREAAPPEPPAETRAPSRPGPPRRLPAPAGHDADWMDEVGELAENTLEWPALQPGPAPEPAAAAASAEGVGERGGRRLADVHYLFPQPETAEWEVGELPPTRPRPGRARTGQTV